MMTGIGRGIRTEALCTDEPRETGVGMGVFVRAEARASACVREGISLILAFFFDIYSSMV